ncbi:MAG: FGGY-family carbohydrate kinase [Lachnospiraceae bacterium]|nr:FGGY-family carbohydrate kinase [Lachnospiraceae bacterium]
MLNKEEIKKAIREGRLCLGIELGSTRIKGVLIGEDFTPVASGDHTWENKLVDGIWTYSVEEIGSGLRACYKSLADNVRKEYGEEITDLACIGISAMMHGYMPFNEKGEILVPFRTWRNTITGQAADELTELFGFNIPQRWSVAHLYQAILNKELHVKDIRYLTTLEGYVHWMLTGKKVLGIGDCAGMFPIDGNTKNYNESMVQKFDKLMADKGVNLKFKDIMPKVLTAGEDAGCLTEEGARFLDPTGHLKAGIRLCPPEGDAGTGMVATNSVGARTCNVSAGTSCFAMVVLEHDLKKLHREIDMVTTPDGLPVAMVHCNNCTSDLNAWIDLFEENLKLFGVEADKNTIYEKLYTLALKGDKDCGGLMSFPYFSGEHVTHLDEGRPMFLRKPDANFNLANFMRTHLISSLGVLKLGMEILNREENVKVDSVMGHGGLFKTKGVGQSILAAVMESPVTCMETAGEGGAWGAALLAAFAVKGEGLTLPEFLNKKVFAEAKGSTLAPDDADIKGIEEFMTLYKSWIAAEKAAVNADRR